MEPDKLSNHLPLYPDPERTIDYNRQIMRKQEYRRLSAKNSRQSDIYFNHQVLTQTHMSIQTGNRSLLIIKDPGVGKTCDAIGLAETRHEFLEQVLDTNDPILGNGKLNLSAAIILTTNKTVMNDNFKRDIMSTCTAGSYSTENLKTYTYSSESKKLSAKTRSIGKAYDLYTHTAFCNMIEYTDPETKIMTRMSDEEIAKRFSFRVIIIDEIHEFNSIIKHVEKDDGTFKEVSKKKNYDRLMRFINNVHGCVIIGLSATPIRDDIMEFPSIINIILEPHLRITVDEWTTLVRNDDIPLLKESLERFLVPRLRGKISRMRMTKQTSKTVVRGNEDKEDVAFRKLSTEKLWLSKVDNRNAQEIDFTYIIEAYSRSIEPATRGQQVRFYQDAIFADNVIWPPLPGTQEGTFGTEAISRNIEPAADGAFRFTQDFMKDFLFRVHEARVTHVLKARKKFQELTAEKEEMLKINPQTDLREIDQKMAEQTQIDTVFMSRIQRFPTGEFDRNDSTDLYTLLYTIRSRYSPTFADVIEQIIGIEYFNTQNNKYEYFVSPETNSFNIDRFDPNDKDNRECVYFYNYYKTGGIIPFGLFISFFGYEELNPSGKGSFISSDGKTINLTRRKRYALLFSAGQKDKSGKSGKKSMSDSKTRKILELFNHPQNKYGHYLKIVAGTEVTAQSINFKNVRQSHLTHRGWHLAANRQLEGRTDRPGGSHEAFDDSEQIPEFFYPGIKTTYNVIQKEVREIRDGKEITVYRHTQKYVKLYRHAALYPTVNLVEANGEVRNLSVYIKMFDAAAQKDLKNAIPLDIMSRIAYDYLLNLGSDEEQTGIPLAYYPPNPNNPNASLLGPNTTSDQEEISYVTYNIFHARKELEYIKCRVRGYFKSYFQLRLIDIVRFCSAHHHSTVIKALTEMVNDNERIVDRHGMLNYIREENDIFFLQKVPRGLPGQKQQWLSYYSSHNYVSSGVSITKMADDLEIQTRHLTLVQIDNLPPEDIQTKISTMLKILSSKAKQYLVEYLILRHRDLTGLGSKWRNLIELILNELFPSLSYAPNNGIVVHAYDYFSKQEKHAKGQASMNRLTGKASEALRVFVIQEDQWRNSSIDEDDTFKPLMNNAFSRNLNRRISNATHYGISSIIGGIHKFSIQDRPNLDSSSTVLTANDKISGRDSAKETGREAFSTTKEYISWHLFNTPVNVTTFIRLYPPYMKGSEVRFPMIIFLMRLDPGGTHLFQGESYSFQTSADGHPMYVCNDLEIGKSIPRGSFIKDAYYRYTSPYPEILGWILLKELREADPAVMNRNNKLFFPLIKAGSWETYLLPPIENANIPGQAPRQHYPSILSAIPMDRRHVYLGTGSDFVGEIINYEDSYNFTSTVSSIYQSMKILYENVANGGPPTYVGKAHHSPKFKEPIFIESRLMSVYGGNVFNKQDLVILLYLIYFLRGTI